MLDKIADLGIPFFKSTPVTVKVPVQVLSGQTVAKNRTWSALERARLAAKMRLGAVLVSPPTIKHCSLLFGVPVAKVVEELNGLSDRGIVAQSAIDSIWAGMSDRERDAFTMRNQTTVWDSVSRVTA